MQALFIPWYTMRQILLQGAISETELSSEKLPGSASSASSGRFSIMCRHSPMEGCPAGLAYQLPASQAGAGTFSSSTITCWESRISAEEDQTSTA